MFPYTINSLTDTNSGEMISSLVYKGAAIENCTIDSVTAEGDVTTSTDITLKVRI